MYSIDLAPYAYYTSQPFPGVRTIGWLDGSHTFTVGRTSISIIEKLRAIMRGGPDVNVHANQIRGVHACNICGAERFVDPDLRVGSTEIWLPDDAGGYFASPSMIIHYITERGYLPRREFLQSVETFDLKRPFNAQAEYERLAAEVMTS